jgi:hypothetical protein
VAETIRERERQTGEDKELQYKGCKGMLITEDYQNVHNGHGHGHGHGVLTEKPQE